MRERAIERMWESSSGGAGLARAALTPASWGYAAVVAARNAAYDHGWLPSRDLALPAVSVGNLTVGGTGKTPVSAFIAARLFELGQKPAIVMRGYGGDESLVHERLNPSIPVFRGADRVAGALQARAAGCTVVVLDDAFQHRQARRRADVVLLPASLDGPVQLLPAGPWREPLSSLKRASLVMVTRKDATIDRARDLLARALRFAQGTPGAILHLAPARLEAWSSGESRDLATLAGQRVLAVAAIGDPRAFSAQLTALGAGVTLVAEGDHHAWSARDATVLAGRAAGADAVICTLKDAVKLGPVWPREASPLWYLSQRVVVEDGAPDFDRILATFAAPRPTN
jgi:tetraacyldisaccharide 4'-kinase